MTNTPRRYRLADGQILSLYPPSPSYSSFGAASVLLCCSAPPACSSIPLRLPVHYPSISLVVNKMCIIQIFCDHLNVYFFDQIDLCRFEVRSELYGANARLVVIPPSLSPSHTQTPPPSRWPALTTFPPVAKFQLVWNRLCEALLSFSSLAGLKHPSLLSRICLQCRRYKVRFSLNMKTKSSIIFADTVDALTATFAVSTRPSSKGRSSATIRG